MKLAVELTARHNSALVSSILLPSVVLFFFFIIFCLEHTSHVTSVCNVSLNSSQMCSFILPLPPCPHLLLISVMLALV